MKWNLAASLLTLFVVEVHAPPPADACGVKLTVKSQAPRKAVARSSNPSDVLLLGDPPRRLESDLTAAGHRVEVAPTPAAAKRKSYAVVITDSKLQDQARSSFSGSVVLVRSGDSTADVRTVEKQVARKPVRADESRAVVAARPSRTPIAAGPQRDTEKRVVASKEPEATEPVAPPPAEKAVTVPKPAASEVKAPVVTPTEPPRAKPAIRESAASNEVFFAYNSFRLGPQATRTLEQTVRWLSANTSARVVVEGHADPTGNADDNMALAQRRAELVRDFLVSAGVDASRIEVVSYGDTRLKYGRTDQRNRRAAVVAK